MGHMKLGWGRKAEFCIWATWSQAREVCTGGAWIQSVYRVPGARAGRATMNIQGQVWVAFIPPLHAHLSLLSRKAMCTRDRNKKKRGHGSLAHQHAPDSLCPARA